MPEADMRDLELVAHCGGHKLIAVTSYVVLDDENAPIKFETDPQVALGNLIRYAGAHEVGISPYWEDRLNLNPDGPNEV